MKLRLIIPVLLTLLVQRMLGVPGLPPWTAEILLPTVWIVAAALLVRDRGWPYAAMVLGLFWDLLLEPVVGPGGIAWSAAALALYALAGVVADRSAKAWAGFGAVGAAVIFVMHHIALLPLGLAPSFSAMHLVRTVLLTSVWCGLVKIVILLDLPAQWREYRVRKLR